MEDWAEIRRLYRSEKLSQAAIARQLALSRNTVAKACLAHSARTSGTAAFIMYDITTLHLSSPSGLSAVESVQ